MQLRNAFGLVLAVALPGGCATAGAGEEASIDADEAGRSALFVANKRGDSLSRIDLVSGRETKRVPTCANPHELAVSPDERHLAVACYAGTALEIYAASDPALVARIELGEGARPHGLIWHRNGMIIATAEGRGSIFTVTQALSGAPLVREIGDGVRGSEPGPHMVAVDEAGGYAWGAVIPTSRIVRYDLANGRVAGETTLSGETEAIALAPDGETLWVGANWTNRAYRLDARTLAIRGELATGPVPIRIAMHPQGRWAVISNYGDGSLSVIDTVRGEVVRTIPISGSREAAQVTLAFSEDGARLYAAETATDTIAEVDFATGEVLRRLATGEGGDGLAILK